MRDGVRLPSLACNLAAIAPERRASYDEAKRVLLAEATIEETDDVFVFTIDRVHLSPARLAEWAADESRCCPAIDFDLHLPAGGPLQLRLGTGAEVKAFLAAELGLARQ